MMNFLAIDVGGTFTKYSIVDENGNICSKRKVSTVTSSRQEFEDFLCNIYCDVAQNMKVDGIALSMPGLIDSKKGILNTGGFIECMKNVNIVEVMQEKCNTFVTVENDATCAAYAELWKGSLCTCNNAIVIVCGTGVGGAVIQNRKVIKGANYLVGEFSYMLNFNDSEYRRECLLGPQTSVRKLLRTIAEEMQVSPEEMDGEKFFELANSGNEKALNILRKYVSNLAILIHNLSISIEFEKVSIGGGISEQALLLDMLRKEMEKINSLMNVEVVTPEIEACKFYNDANLIGAVYAHQLHRKEELCFQ